jgi:hypothetical protein
MNFAVHPPWMNILGLLGRGFEPRATLQQSDALSTGPCLTPVFFSETFSKFATVNLYKKYFLWHPIGGNGASSEGRPEEKKGATTGPPPPFPAPRPDIDKYLLDPGFQYVDFAQRDKQNAFPTFRIQVPGNTGVFFAVADPELHGSASFSVIFRIRIHAQSSWIRIRPTMCGIHFNLKPSRKKKIMDKGNCQHMH